MWDYPRPPRVERADSHVVVVHAGVTIADTRRAWRVLETSQPPAFYLPPDDVVVAHLRPSPHRTSCEGTGLASYRDVVVGEVVADDAGWTYPEPTPGYEAIRDHLAFYPQSLDACMVDGEKVAAAEGGFYGGWITSKIVGPFKGGPGTLGW